MDSPEEWLRLKELYARMNEGELEVVANEAYDLTEIARPLLRDEIARRGLKIQLLLDRKDRREPAPPPDPHDLVEAGVYFDAADARTVAEYLRPYGVSCFWGPESAENPDTLDYADGVELMVREEDFASASEALRQLFTRFKPKAPEGLDQERICTCPKCHSEEIVFQEIDAQTAKFNWSCDACGHVWNDDGVEQQKPGATTG